MGPANNKSTYFYDYFTFGGVVSNQIGNNPGISQYVNFGFGFRTHEWIDATLTAFFTSESVAASSSGSTQVTTSAGPATISTPFNILTTQQSARILETLTLQAYKPRISVWPLFNGGFSTLLNPSSSASVPSSSGTASNVASLVQYSQAYNEYAVGVRVREQGEKSWQLDTTFGKFSNFQSVKCGIAGTSATTQSTAPTNTSCFTSAPGTYTLLPLKRTSVPRLEISGFKILSDKYVIGLDANLSQYSLFVPKNLDTLNRPGSEVRVYVGLTGTVEDLFKAISQMTPSNK